MARWRGGGPRSIGARGLQLVIVAVAWITTSPGSASPGVAGPVAALIVAAATLTTVAVLHQRFGASHGFPARSDDVSVVATAASSGAVAAALASLAFEGSLGMADLVLGWSASFLALLFVRGVIRQGSGRGGARRVTVIGVGEDARELSGLLLDHPEVDLELVGVIGDRATAEGHGLHGLWLGPVDRLADLLDSHRIDGAVVTMTGVDSPQFRSILGVLREAGVEPLLSTGVARLASANLRIGSVVHESLVSVEWIRPTRLYRGTKRAIDVAGAVLGLLLAAPLIALAAVAIKLEDRGPVFFRSPRVGADHQRFGMLKLRSMRVDADDRRNDLAQRNERSGPLFKVTNDPRVTRVGRLLRETSIDELPQLVNVLQGHMSLVGPRPALPEEAAAFDRELQARFRLRPGLTGLWQVEARSNANFSAYRRLDLHYVANQSLRLDLEILVATAVQIVVALALLPVRPFVGGRSVDGVEPDVSAPIIDLRDRRVLDLAEAAEETIPRTAT